MAHLPPNQECNHLSDEEYGFAAYLVDKWIKENPDGELHEAIRQIGLNTPALLEIGEHLPQILEIVARLPSLDILQGVSDQPALPPPAYDLTSMVVLTNAMRELLINLKLAR